MHVLLRSVVEERKSDAVRIPMQTSGKMTVSRVLALTEPLKIFV